MAIDVGQKAPDFTLKDETGADVSLDQFRGRNVVLVFFPMAFSGTCTTELHDLARSAHRFDDANAEVIGISVDSIHALRAFKRHEDLKARLLADFHPKGAVAQLYDVYLEDKGFANRATFVIDKDGRIVERFVTSPAEARNAEEYIEALARCPV